MTKPSIGFIGVGLMGAAMCSRLLDKGYNLTVIANRSRERIDELIARDQLFPAADVGRDRLPLDRRRDGGPDGSVARPPR